MNRTTWWIDVACAIALAVLIANTLGGCADAPVKTSEPQQLLAYSECTDDCRGALTPRPASPSADPRDAVISVLAQALSQRAPMAACVEACGAPLIAVETTQQVYYRSNADVVGNVAGMLKMPLGLLAGGKALQWVLEESAGSMTNIEGNTGQTSGDSQSVSAGESDLSTGKTNPVSETHN